MTSQSGLFENVTSFGGGSRGANTRYNNAVKKSEPVRSICLGIAILFCEKTQSLLDILPEVPNVDHPPQQPSGIAEIRLTVAVVGDIN